MIGTTTYQREICIKAVLLLSHAYPSSLHRLLLRGEISNRFLVLLQFTFKSSHAAGIEKAYCFINLTSVDSKASDGTALWNACWVDDCIVAAHLFI